MPVEIRPAQMDLRAAALYLSKTVDLFSYLRLPLPLVFQREGGFYKSEKSVLALPVKVVRVSEDTFSLSNAVVREIGMHMAVLTNSLTSVGAFCASSSGFDTAAVVWAGIRHLVDVPWPWAPAFRASRCDIRECLADLYGRMVFLCNSFGRLERAATIALHSGPWKLETFAVSRIVQKASMDMAAPAKRIRKHNDADLLVFGRIPLRISQRDKCILALRLIFDLYETAGCYITQIKAAHDYVYTKSTSLPHD